MNHPEDAQSGDERRRMDGAWPEDRTIQPEKLLYVQQ